jgi:hypothetical protein
MAQDRGTHSMKMTSRQLLDIFDQVLTDVRREIASGELDGSGRFFTDEELAAGAATGKLKKKDEAKPAPAA